MPLWKRILVRSIGIGVGFALTVCAFVGLWAWYSSKPKPEKPWNSTAVKATWTELTLSTDADKCYFQFGYSLENTTDSDYAIPATAKLLVRLPKDMSYTENPELSWQHGDFIPAGKKLNVHVRVPFNCAEYNFSRAKYDDQKQVANFADRRLSELDGFALFDSVNRFRVDFPNGWPDVGKRIAQQEQTKN